MYEFFVKSSHPTRSRVTTSCSKQKNEKCKTELLYSSDDLEVTDEYSKQQIQTPQTKEEESKSDPSSNFIKHIFKPVLLVRQNSLVAASGQNLVLHF